MRCHPTSVHVLSLNLNSSALWNPRHWSASSTRTRSFQARVHIFLRSSIKSIHFFRLLSLCGHLVPKNGILCLLIPFASSLMFPHLAATHLSGIFEKRAEIPRLVFIEIQRKAEVTCSWIYVTALAKPRETNANGGPKWRQIWTSYKIHKKIRVLCKSKTFFTEVLRVMFRFR